MWLLVGSAFAVVVLVVIVLLVALTPSGGDSSGDDNRMVRLNTSSTTAPGSDAAGDDEAQIQQLMDDYVSAADGESMADVAEYYCAAERRLITELDLGDMPLPSGSVTVRDVRVKGVRVTGKVAAGRVDGDPVYFRKESGDWKLCNSARNDF